jgi:hypothetical protein
VMSGEIPGKKIVCVISGGNIDNSTLELILSGGTPN